MGKHKVKTFKWIKGLLHVEELEFQEIEDAIIFSTKVGDSKVYHENGELVYHSYAPPPAPEPIAYDNPDESYDNPSSYDYPESYA
jgi:hypothetical protein